MHPIDDPTDRVLEPAELESVAGAGLWQDITQFVQNDLHPNPDAVIDGAAGYPLLSG